MNNIHITMNNKLITYTLSALLFVFPVHLVFIFLKNLLYDFGVLKGEKVEAKVISIGNIALGGTGKTPTAILIANELSHILMPGHSGSRDAKDNKDNVYEYKHFKETSSNHSWTFNDFSDTTIKKLIDTKSIIFAHIDDTLSISNKFILDWYYEVSGKTMSIYLTEKVKNIKNTRKMINVSPNQIEKSLNIFKINLKNENINGSYYKDLEKIYDIIKELAEYANRKEEIFVDLNEEKIIYGNNEVRFKVDPFKKKCLLEGLDDIALSLNKSKKIESFEKDLKSQKPWIFND